MAMLADDVVDTAGVGSSNFDASPGVAAAAAAVALNQTDEDQEDVVYNCRMCRRAVFNGADIAKHEAAQHNFRRRKVPKSSGLRESLPHIGSNCGCCDKAATSQELHPLA
ncbi:unnamed protein product [Ectocarpus sp. 6 AP-2014]